LAQELYLRTVPKEIFLQPWERELSDMLTARQWGGDPNAPFKMDAPSREIAEEFGKNILNRISGQEVGLKRLLGEASKFPGVKQAIQAGSWTAGLPGVNQAVRSAAYIGRVMGFRLDESRPFTSLANGLNGLANNLLAHPMITGTRHGFGDIITKIIATPDSLLSDVSRGMKYAVKRYAGLGEDQQRFLEKYGIVQRDLKPDQYALLDKLTPDVKSKIYVAKIMDNASKAGIALRTFDKAIASGKSYNEATRLMQYHTWFWNNYSGAGHLAPWLTTPVGHVARLFNVGRGNMMNNLYTLATNGEFKPWVAGAGVILGLALLEAAGSPQWHNVHVGVNPLAATSAYGNIVNPERWWMNRDLQGSEHVFGRPPPTE
jgi:hypothetical protein